MKDENNPDALAQLVYWWSVAGIVFAVFIFFISSFTNSLTTTYLARYIKSTEYASKNDAISILSPFLKNDVLSFGTSSPDILKQALSAALIVGNENITQEEIDQQISQINNLDDYNNAIRIIGDPIVTAKTIQRETSSKIFVLNNWQSLFFLFLIVSQIISARLAFKLFRMTSK